ncbi:Interferon-induced GTP-binding protein Mx2 [Lamellibrachia satsuma]|nr:Interferon-induced GTP-binding protein Mx2 [Lamellibrachia satsuma]
MSMILPLFFDFRVESVVTKPDLIDIGTEKGLIDIINNETYPLEKGYSCVRCRGQKAINDGQTLAEAIQQDTDFFSSAPHFSDVDESILGVKNLAMKLTYELVKQIKKALPEMSGQIQEKLNLTKRAVENMTPGIPEAIGQRTIYLLQLLQQYTDDIKNVVSGEHKGLKGPQLVPRCREYYELLATKTRALTPAQNERYIEHIMELSSGQRGRELPRFLKYSICEALIVEIVEKYEEPLMETLQDVSQLVGDIFGKLATNKFENLPHLDRKIKGLVDRLRVEADNACQDALRKLLKMEKRPFAQDDTYRTTLDYIIEQEQKWKKAEKQYLKKGYSFGFGSVHQPGSASFNFGQPFTSETIGTRPSPFLVHPYVQLCHFQSQHGSRRFHYLTMVQHSDIRMVMVLLCVSMCYTKHGVCLLGKLTKNGNCEAVLEQGGWFVDDASQSSFSFEDRHAPA